MQNQARTTDDISLHFLEHRTLAAGVWPLVPCNGEEAVAYNLDSLGQDHYCLTIAAPGHDLDDVEIGVDGGMLRIKGATDRTIARGRRLHQGLYGSLDCAFLMLEPLTITCIDLEDGLLSIELQGDWIDCCVMEKPSEASSGAVTMALAA